jgi:hydrogenase nickel incorporation protein HypB
MDELETARKILNANEKHARANGRLLAENGVFCLNLISSPGSGKTTTLVRTIEQAGGSVRMGVIEGDIATDIDAERIRAAGVPVVQINTHGACHLSAAQVKEALGKLALEELDVVFIENVGNLVCPAAFELGESAKVAILSVAEGQDKVVKYPAVFARAKALLINKIDLLGCGVDFDIDFARRSASRLNRSIETFAVSAKTGEGIDRWCRWVEERAKGASAG